MKTIGIATASAVVPKIELSIGMEKLASCGFNVILHPNTHKRFRYMAGTDDERARAIFDVAKSPEVDVLWCARGGYGATRILSILDELTRKRGKPSPKLLVGYSDVTALHEYVRRKWGWFTLHASMPGSREFTVMSRTEWNALSGWVSGKRVHEPWGALKFVGPRPKQAIRGELMGGNLSVLAAMVGTPHAVSARGKILFVEDVEEKLYRIDRMLEQLLASGALKGVKAIVLGNWLACGDAVHRVLKARPDRLEMERVLKNPRPEEMTLLRPKLSEKVILDIFSDVARELKVPLAHGLPVGHGPDHSPLPLGARYELSPKGEFSLLSWDWLNSSLF